jgi:RNA polymerase sigma factor (sigma-70 family)
MTSGVVPHQALPLAEQQSDPGQRRSSDQQRSSLVSGCLAGDEAAWGELVRRYERLVYSVALRQGLSLDDAADVTQAVFEALFISLPGLRDEDKVAPWLISVTQRQSWRARRRNLREASLSELAAASGSALAESTAGTDAHDELERSLWLYQALRGLPEPCRSLLVALYFDPDEPSYAQVALHLKRPLGSIGPTRARCLDQLRRALLAEGDRK